MSDLLGRLSEAKTVDYRTQIRSIIRHKYGQLSDANTIYYRTQIRSIIARKYGLLSDTNMVDYRTHIHRLSDANKIIGDLLSCRFLIDSTHIVGRLRPSLVLYRVPLAATDAGPCLLTRNIFFLFCPGKKMTECLTSATTVRLQH